MQLITTYSPPSFLTPCAVFSTLAHETAVCFVQALHGNHALSIIFASEGISALTLEKSDFIVIKKHKTPEDALAYHSKLALQFRNGESDQLWEKGWKPYLKIRDKYCPEELIK